MKSIIPLSALLITLSFCRVPAHAQWAVGQKPNLLEFFYTNASGTSQYAALHTNDSYFRLNPGSGAGWGTSVVLMPSFWASGNYYQGTPVSVTWKNVGDKLELTLQGSKGGLSTTETVTLHPPQGEQIRADVTANVSGNVSLDNRPGEAFKLFMFSSMHESDTQWDAQQAYVDCTPLNLPLGGWVTYPARTGSVLGLKGGTSSWKTKAPTIEARMITPSSVSVTGFVTTSTDPNDDNVGYWAASNQIVRNYQYTLIGTNYKPTKTLKGQIRLGSGYAKSYSDALVGYIIRNADTEAIVQTGRLMLDSVGNFSIDTSLCGRFDVMIKGRHWLQKGFYNQFLYGTDGVGLNATLVNGDVNNDNVVDDFDLFALTQDFLGAPTQGVDSDLTENGTVDDLDLFILTNAFLMVGDS